MRLSNAIFEANTGAAASTTSTAAVEAAAGLLGRSFASAKVTPDNELTASLSPSVLNLIGRDLIRRGESLWVIGVSEGAVVSLHPAGSWDVNGDPVGHGRGESGWYYRLDLFGPSSNVTRYLPRLRRCCTSGIAWTRPARGKGYRPSNGPALPLDSKPSLSVRWQMKCSPGLSRNC